MSTSKTASIFTKSNAKKAIALTLAATFALTTALPIASAEAGHKKHKRKHHNNGDLLAAGIVGLALGAIIVDHANKKRKRRHTYSHTYVQPQPSYQPYYDSDYGDDYNDYNNGNDYRVRRPLPKSKGIYTNEVPQVIRYEDEFQASYEPWTPEWQSWCRNKYRSFKPSNGTFRGYDGKNHFCVVK